MDEVVNNAGMRGFASAEGAGGWTVRAPSDTSDYAKAAPFSLMTDGTDTFMYVPAGSVTINGKEFSPSGLTAHDITDWYVVTSFTAGLNLYVVFDNTAYAQSGKPLSAEFGTSAPSGRVITIPILAASTDGLVSIAYGAVYHERPSFDGEVASSCYKSIDKSSGGGGWTDEDHTLQVRGFRNGDAPNSCLLCTGDSVFHALGVREFDGCSADMKWVTDADLAEAVGQWLVCNCSWVCDGGGGSSDFCLNDDFFCWYDSLADGCGFWEQGENYAVNYGSSIGNSGACLAIDLDCSVLQGDWDINGDLCVDIVNSNHVCTCSLNIWGATFSIAGCSITICSTDGTLRAT